VFVVGAGASKSYGVGTANDLYEKAIGLGSASDIYQLLLSCCYERIDVELSGAIKNLAAHGGPSIDEFIEQRWHSPHLVQFGKLTLAALMGVELVRLRERERETKPKDDDWLRHLADCVAAGVSNAKDFAEMVASNLSFVTFNFDSIIEQQMAARIRERYAGDPDLSKALRAVNVIHIHGALNAPPQAPLRGDRGAPGYTAVGISGEWIEWTRAAAETIHLTHEEIERSLLAKVQDLIGQVEMLCFMGFRYESGNLAKLGLPARLKHSSSQHIAGTGYGLTPAERERVVEIFGDPTIRLGDKPCKCRAFLDEYRVIR